MTTPLLFVGSYGFFMALYWVFNDSTGNVLFGLVLLSVGYGGVISVTISKLKAALNEHLEKTEKLQPYHRDT